MNLPKKVVRGDRGMQPQGMAADRFACKSMKCSYAGGREFIFQQQQIFYSEVKANLLYSTNIKLQQKRKQAYMAATPQPQRLKKELGFFSIYAIATGATFSSGFFLLPGLAAAQAGPAVILSYLIAAIHLIPAVFSMAELSTAMPRAGGVYYFLDRSMGPLYGTIGGMGTWLAMVLKTAFALIGMGAYVNLYFPEAPMVPLAVSFAVLFGLINIFGAKKTGGFQILMVLGLFVILLWFCIKGVANVNQSHLQGFFAEGFGSIYTTAGLVYISYVGITKIASISEEVRNPEKNLPLGMMFALITAIVLYAVGVFVMVGVIPPNQLSADLTPAATAARYLAGPAGAAFMSAAAILAFFSVANAAILSASRYPMAMSRDHLMPAWMGVLSKFGTPANSIYLTVAVIIIFLISFDPTGIAKLASAFQLLLFAFSCLAVIIMRESRIESYDPGFKSPLYPWMQIFGIGAPIVLIYEMGFWSILFTAGLIAIGTYWYFKYSRHRVVRDGAMYHIFQRLGERRFDGLDTELRGILKEKGLRDEDPFDMVIARARFIELRHNVAFKHVVEIAANALADRVPMPPQEMITKIMQGTRLGATPVSHGVALPHLRIAGLPQQELVMVRTRNGVTVEIENLDGPEPAQKAEVFAFFFLVSDEDNPGQHLRLLAQIASEVDDPEFIERWKSARGEHQLKEIFLRDERVFTLTLLPNRPGYSLVGKKIADLEIPEGSLVAVIYRNREIIVPGGQTRLRTGDRITIIGQPAGIRKLRARYVTSEPE